MTPPTAGQVIDGVQTGATVAEALNPVVGAFGPLISLVLTAIRAHYIAKGGDPAQIAKLFPSEADVIAAVPLDVAGVRATWAVWDATKGSQEQTA